jgi:aminocarboxymuconate-semialdehyde decarboxylase
MWIDLHVHHVERAMLNLDGHWGPTYEGGRMRIGHWILGTKRPMVLPPGADGNDVSAARFTPERRLAKMDELGMDKVVLAIPAHMYMYWTEPEFNVRFSTVANDSFAAYCETNPDRFYFWAHVPMQDPAAAVREAQRAFALGAKGICLGGANFGGREIHDRAFYPLWEQLCEHAAPIFVHGYNQSVTWGDQAMDDPFDTTSILGMNSDETKLFWYMINGGVLDDFPDLRVYITHGGGFVPYQLGRFAATNKTMAPDSKNRKAVDEYRDNFYFDVEVHEIPMRNAIVEVIGADHLLYGDNFNGADGIDWDLTEGMDLSPEDREKIRGGNAMRLLGL